jgi:hypothetical protein
MRKTNSDLKSTFQITREMSEKIFVIPPHRTRYLSEIAESNRKYDDSLESRTSSSYMVFSKQLKRFRKCSRVKQKQELMMILFTNCCRIEKDAEDKIFKSFTESV